MTTKFSRTQPRRSLRLIAAIAAVELLACGSNAWAGTIIGLGPDPAPLPGPFFGDDNQNDKISVGTPAHPVVVQPAVDGSPWAKQFEINRDGQGWSTSGPQSMVTVEESITVLSLDPSTPLGYPRVVDWHEEIVEGGDGANFKWVGGQVTFITSPLPPFPATVSPDGKSIWFDFPGIPFVPMLFTKQLMWTGPETTPGPTGTNNYRITVIEAPSIPEPASLTLMGLTIACAAGPIGRRRCAA